MAEIVNLRRARKAKARGAAASGAAANRAKYGRSKADKALQTAQTARADKRSKQHRLDPRGPKP